MIKYITTEHGFAKENITVLMDDNKHTKPTKQAILDAFVNLVQSCEEGDIVFCHFAGTFSTKQVYHENRTLPFDQYII